MLLHELLEQQSEHHGRHEGDADGEDEAARFRSARQVDHHADQTTGVEQADGQDGRQLNDEHQDVETLEGDLPRLALVALHFPKWVDGRAYSQAHLLRARYRFEGEIRATGEVLVDMLPLLQRTGFDAVVLRGDQSQDAARRALGFFPGHYQGDVRDAQPLFAKPDGTADALVRKAAPQFVSAGEGI